MSEEIEGRRGAEGAWAALVHDLDKVFDAESQRLRERLDAGLQGVRREGLEAASGLAKSREKLAALFAEAQAAPGEAAVQRLMNELDGQVTWIFRKLRPALDRELKQLSPRRRPVQSALAATVRGYAGVVARLPGAPGRPAPVPEGAAPRLRALAVARLGITPRALVEEILAARADERRHPLVLRYEEGHRLATGRLADIWRGLRFHLEVAVDDLREAGAEQGAGRLEGAASLVREVLAEAEGQLPAVGDGLAELAAELPEALAREHRDFTDAVRREIENLGSWPNIGRHLWRRLSRQRARAEAKARQLAALGREEVRLSAGSGIAQTGSLLKNLQTLLGKPGKTQETLLALTDLPTTAQLQERTAPLPPLYRRLFTLGPLRNREFLVGREEELDELDDVLQRWLAGKACSVALVGPEGSGKSSLLNCFENQVGGKGEVLRTRLGRRLEGEEEVLRFFREWLGAEADFASPQAVTEHILAGPRRILVLEGGHNLGLRVMGGYRAARAFFHVLLATRRHCLWVVAFRQYPWTRIDYQLGVGQYFTHQVRTLFHDQAEIEETILLRHRTSGLSLVFLGETEGDSPDVQKQLKERYFRELAACSFGNIEAAIVLWLFSLEYDAAGNALRVAPLGRLDYGFLRALGREYSFALAETVAHGGLEADEYCRIFRADPLSARMTLDYLAHLNLLVAGRGEKDEAVRYRLNPVFFGPVTETLEAMNILY